MRKPTTLTGHIFWEPDGQFAQTGRQSSDDRQVGNSQTRRGRQPDTDKTAAN